MKQTISIFILILAFGVSTAIAQKTGKLTIKTKYVGIVEGYDHTNKTQVYANGELVGESKSGPESEPLSFSVQLPRGVYDLKIINLAFYEGNWEEHTKDNNYSLDALYETSITLKKKCAIELVFDIDAEETKAKVK